MYYCNECKTMFENPGVESEFQGERGHGGEVEYPVCPNCKSDDFEKAGECAICGEYVEPESDICESCLTEREEK